LAGDYSIADMATYPWVIAAWPVFKSLPPERAGAMAHVEGWLERVGERAAVQRGMKVPAGLGGVRASTVHSSESRGQLSTLDCQLRTAQIASSDTSTTTGTRRRQTPRTPSALRRRPS